MTFQILRHEEAKAYQPSPGEHFMTVQLLGSGWTAVEMWISNEHEDLEPFLEPYNTGIGRYATVQEAHEEALFLARDNKLLYVLPKDIEM